jgi:hypothetical protein
MGQTLPFNIGFIGSSISTAKHHEPEISEQEPHQDASWGKILSRQGYYRHDPGDEDGKLHESYSS